MTEKSETKPPKTTPAALPAPQPAPESGSGSGLAVFALVVALASAGGAGYLGYRLYQNEQRSASVSSQIDSKVREAVDTAVGQSQVAITALRGEVSSRLSQIEALQGTLGQHSQRDEKALEELSARVQSLNLGQRGVLDSLEAIKTAAQKGDVNAFTLSETEYLLRLAEHKVRLQQDVVTGLQALELAERRLAAANETAFTPVQRMLAENIATLRGVRTVNIADVSHRIIEMEKRIQTLPLRIDAQVNQLKGKVKPQIGVTDTTPATAEEPWWEKIGNAAWAQFKDVIIVRNERRSGPPLVSVGEEYFLMQNLRLELEAMRIALLRGDAPSFQESNEIARTWVETYFDSNDARVSSLLAELKELHQLQLNPYLPDLSGTVKAFQDIMAHRQPVRTLTTGTEEAKP